MVTSPPIGTPANVVVVLLDSLNRHLLGCYGGDRVRHAEPRPVRAHGRCASPTTTPARCRACRRATTSSCGALDFLWRPWGSIELWEDADHRTRCGARASTTMLVTDHPHLFETGGENYHTDFTAWDYERGHEGDPWRTRPDPIVDRRARCSAAARVHAVRRLAHVVPRRGRLPRAAHDGGRGRSGSTTKRRRHDRFLLFVDEFDPHEPFDTPEPWASLLRPRLGGPAPDLAAVRDRRDRERACSTERAGPPDPRAATAPS